MKAEIAPDLSLIGDALIPEVEKNLRGDLAVSRRLFHGRGHTFPGLEFISVDWFDPMVLVTLYRAVGEDWLHCLAERLHLTIGNRNTALLLQCRHLPGTPIRTIVGEAPNPHYAREEGLEYRLRIGGAQNVGFFLDMSKGRLLVRKRARGKRVLNLFSYTCSFSVAALAGGAANVVNIDMNRGALATGRENHLRNGHDLRQVSFLAYDIFKSFGKLKKLGPFDLVIADPPTGQQKSFSAATGWPKLVSRLGRLLASDGEVLACLNAPQLSSSFLKEIFSEHLSDASLVGQFGPPSTFPEKDRERGLKILHYTLQEAKAQTPGS